MTSELSETDKLHRILALLHTFQKGLKKVPMPKRTVVANELRILVDFTDELIHRSEAGNL